MAVLICAVISILSACTKPAAPAKVQDEIIDVYADFYPIYALAGMITDNVSDIRLNCLVQPQDGCLRNYALSNWDLALLQSADIAIIGGSGLESFEALLTLLGKNGPAIIAALDENDMHSFQAVNMQGDTDSHGSSSNPHIYMKTDGAISILRRIAGSLSILYPQFEPRFMENLTAAEARLVDLQQALKQLSSVCAHRKVAVLNEALTYVAEELDLDIVLCYARESGAELDDVALQECISQIRNSEAEFVLIERQAPQTLISALEAADLNVIKMDTLSTRRAEEGVDGYLDALRRNAELLHTEAE